MSRTPSVSAPAPLLVAAGLVLVEAIGLLALAVVELVSFDSDRVALGITTTVFFVLVAAGLAFCAWSVMRGRSWARAPIVLIQLLQLGVAWSFRSDPTTLVAVALALVAAAVLGGVLHPASIEHLAQDAA